MKFNKSLKQEFYWLMTNIRNKDDCILASKPKILTKSVMTEKIFLACEKINLNFKIRILSNIKRYLNVQPNSYFLASDDELWLFWSDNQKSIGIFFIQLTKNLA
ncbi:MAG: hypothetical protein ACO3YP_07735 [bacterium]